MTSTSAPDEAARTESPWTLHPDRALPADPVTRPIAREIYQAVRDLPIVSMHGHEIGRAHV